ncbi:hypothetical protein SMMN14_06388, partial [Sphaerulina musiva]
MSSLFSCWGALSHCILPQDMHNHHDSINESSSLLYNHHHHNNNYKKKRSSPSSSSSAPLPHFSSDEPEKNHPPYPLPTRPTQKKEGWWCIEVQQKERGEEVLQNDDDNDDDVAAAKSRRKQEKMKMKIKMKIKEKEKNKNKKVKVKKACDDSPSPMQLLHVPSSSPVLWPGGRSLELGEISSMEVHAPPIAEQQEEWKGEKPRLY